MRLLHYGFRLSSNLIGHPNLSANRLIGNGFSVTISLSNVKLRPESIDIELEMAKGCLKVAQMLIRSAMIGPQWDWCMKFSFQYCRLWHIAINKG
jgi:hypothetical protein